MLYKTPIIFISINNEWNKGIARVFLMSYQLWETVITSTIVNKKGENEH